MSSTNQAVGLQIRADSGDTKEKLEALSVAGQAAFAPIVTGANQATAAAAALNTAVAAVPAAAAPATQATQALAQQTQQLTTAQQGNVVSLQAVVEARQRNAAAMQAETSAINAQAAASQRLTTVATSVAGRVGNLVNLGTQLAATQASVSSVAATAASFLSGLGAPGAIAAAAITGIGAAAMYVENRIQASEAAAKSAFEAIRSQGAAAADVIAQVAAQFMTAAERATTLANHQREVLAQNLQGQLLLTRQRQESAQAEIAQGERRVAQIEREQAIEENLRARQRRAGVELPVDTTSDYTSRLLIARSQLTSFRQDLATATDLAQGLVNARQQLERGSGSAVGFRDLGLGSYGPDAPARGRAAAAATAATERLTDAEREYQQVMNQAEAQITRTMTAEDQRAQTMDRLKVLRDAGKISEEEYGAALQRTQQALDAVTSQEQRRAAERAVEQARKDAERQAEQSERANQQATDNIVKYSSDRFADLFDKTKDGWKGVWESVERTAKSTVARIAAELVIRPVISPIVNYLGLGSVAGRSGVEGIGGLNLGGLFGGGATVASNAGSTTAAMQSGQQSLSLASAGRFGNLGNAFTSSGFANTGVGWIDGALNTRLIGGGGEAVGNLTATYGEGVAMGSAANASGGAAGGGLTVAGGLGGAASVLGGAYSIYGGIQKGGIGGGVGVVGGVAGMAGGAASLVGAAAAGSAGVLGSMAPMLAALGPYGMIAAAVLAIVSALLPGEKPSGKGQEFRYDLGSGAVERNGLSGNRFSAGNAEQAENATMQIVNLASEISGKLGGAAIGGEVAVGVTSSRGDGPGKLYLDISGRKGEFANNEDGAKEMAQRAGEYLLDLFKEYGGGNGDYQGILRASGSIEALGQNLEWYEGTYKALTGTAEATSEFTKQVEALNTQWQTAIDKAGELSLATDVLNSKRGEEIAKAYAQRDLQLRGYEIGLDIRAAQATGGDDSALMKQAALMQFDLQAEQQIVQAKATLESLGYSSDVVTDRLARNEAVLAAERLKIQREYGGQSAELQKQQAQGVLDWLNGQALGASSSLTGAERMSEAERQYRAAMEGGDASAITGAAGSLLNISRDVLGGATEAYAQREAWVRTGVANYGVRQAQGSGNADVVAALSQMVVVLQAQLASLGSKFDAMTAEQRRQNDLLGLAA